MLINYIRIQFLRFFKGRSFIALVIAMIIAEGIMFGIALITGKFVNDGIIDTITLEEFRFYLQRILLYGSTLICIPLVGGLLTIVYTCNYYQYRTHINLEIKLRNRFMYALSEVIMIMVMVLIELSIFGIFFGISFLVVPCSYEEFIDQFGGSFVKEILYLPLGLLTSQIFAYFLAKLFRRKALAITFYAVAIYLSFIFMSFPAYQMIAGLAYNPDVTSIDLYAVALLIRCIIIFIASVFLFQRRYEERHI